MIKRLTYAIPATLVAGFLCSYFYLITHYQVQLDDCFFDGLTHTLGFWKTYTFCYEAVNGRWLGNLLATVIFFVSGHDFLAYTLILALFALGFIAAAAFLFASYMQTFRNKKPAGIRSLFYGLVFASALYFLQFSGRREIWGWLDSATVHLTSVILCMLLFALLIRKNGNSSLIFLCALGLGGLNEVNAVGSLLIVAALYLHRKDFAPVQFASTKLLLAAGAIAASLALNISSSGYNMRMAALPDFTLLQALKNTVHTLAMPVLSPDPRALLMLALLAIILLLPYFTGSAPVALPGRMEQRSMVFAAALIVLVFFLNCYTLSDVVPARSALWGHALFLFVLATQISKRIT